MSDIRNSLAETQSKLNAPKDQRNNFGNYNYRTAEGIIAAFKALQCGDETLTLTDEVIAVGDRIFLKATATFSKGNNSISVDGWAMHAMQKKGMDEAQITGSCSSYARKYALCGLFAIDDSRDDPDTKDNRQSGAAPQAVAATVSAIEGQETLAGLQAYFTTLNKDQPEVVRHPDVIAAKDRRKAELSGS